MVWAYVRNDMLRFKRLSKFVRNCGLGASHAHASIEFCILFLNCSQQTWKTVPKTVKLLPTQCPAVFFWNVVSGGETGFMELPHIFLMKCTRHRSWNLHGVGFLCLELSDSSCLPENIPKMHHFFLCCGANIYLIPSPGIFSFLPHFDCQHLRRTGLGGWWLQGGNCSCNGRGRGCDG